LTDDDAALTGRAFAVNPDPIGLMSDGTKDPNIPEAEDTIDDKSKPVNPSANAAVAGKTSYKTSKMEGSQSNQPELAGETIKKNNVTKAAVRQPKGERDPECSRMVIQPKKSGRTRRTVDLSGLSKEGRHESHHKRSAAEIVETVPAGNLKSTLDCVDGYHSVELAKEDRHKTIFATEWGLFHYLRVPQGYLSSGDSYTKHIDAILDDCPEKPSKNDYEKIVDDIIQWSVTKCEVNDLRSFLKRLQ
jgi:hypothetical protein